MKILFVHEIDYENKVIYETHEFPELLSEAGDEVCFLDYPEKTAGENLFGAPKRRKISGRVRSKAQIELISPGFFGSGSIARLSAMLTGLFELARIFTSFRPDAVVNFAVPTYGLQVAILCKLARVPLMHRALDSSHLIRQSRWGVLIKIWESLVFRMSTVISTHNQAMKDYVQFYAPKAEVKIHYPPVDLSRFKPSFEGSRLREKLRIPAEDKIILYMGSFFYFSGIPECIDSMASLEDPNGTGIHLVLIGGGEQEAYLRERVKFHDLEDRVHFFGIAEFDELPKLLSEGDVCINPMIKSRVSDVALPHKVIQYIACGALVVSTRLAGLESSLLGTQNVQYVDSPNDVIPAAVDLITGSVEGAKLGDEFRNRFGQFESAKIFRSAIEELSKK